MPESNKLIEKLLNTDVEVDDLELEELSSEDLAYVVVALRAQVLMLTSLVDTLVEQVRLVDVFARPQTRRFYSDPLGKRIIH